MSRWSCLLLIPVLLSTALRAGPKLEEIPTYTLGLDALSARLWEVAAARFQSALETEKLDPETRQTILLRLAEARIRGNQSEQALAVLKDPKLKDNPARPFWTAQALAADGQFQRAIELIDAEALGPKVPHRRQALLTKVNLQHAIGNTMGAIETLELILKLEPNSVNGRLLKAELLLEQKSPEKALKILPDTKKLKAAAAQQATFLRAQGLLATGKFQQAAELFKKLIDSPSNQAIGHYHGAYLGLARARLARDSRIAAADDLLAFIQKAPNSPLLDEAFDLVIDCLPEQPAPNDPILTRLREWVPAPRLDSPAIFPSNHGASSAWPRANTHGDPLAPEAIFHLAQGLRREGSADSRLSARRLLIRLRLEFPTHPLVARALLEAGRWELEDQRRPQAAACFDALEYLGGESTPELRAQALTLEGTARFNEGDFKGAASFFDQASTLLEADQRKDTLLNAASSLLAASSLAGFDNLAKGVEDPELQVNLALERALFLASVRDPAALPALRSFIADHPQHPRLAKARLQAALAALDSLPPDLDYARLQLDSLDAVSRASLPPATLALAEIRRYDRTDDWANAAKRATEFLSEHPEHPQASIIVFEQGKALFQNKDFNAARLVLEKLAQAAPDSLQAPAALLLSARAAAEGATPQSLNESIALFDQLIDSKSPFAAVARLEKADILIRLSRLDEAIDDLTIWFRNIDDKHPLLTSVGLLLGDALFAQAAEDPKILKLALQVYERLLTVLPPDSPARVRCLYQKGLTLERLDDSESEALIAYMDVVQAAADKPSGDWKTIELCGFSALRILEKREQWRAAKKLAHRIAELHGPRAQEAAERAKTLGMEHMIWDQ